jgi:hypothetical protein
MPDGDIVHENLPRRYQKPYKQLCEGQRSAAELAHEALRPLKGDLRIYGDEPVKLIQQIATVLSQILNTPLLKQSVDWRGQSQIIDRCAQQIDGHRTGMELAVKACKQQLQELRYKSCSYDSVEEMSLAIMRKYVSAVYEANFEERVPLAQQHYNGVAQMTVDARLQGMRVYVEQGIEHFAAQIIHNDSVTTLRRPPMSRRSIGLDDDLCGLSTVGIEG